MGRPCRYRPGEWYGGYQIVAKYRSPDFKKNDAYEVVCRCGKRAVIRTTQIVCNLHGCSVCARAKVAKAIRPKLTTHGHGGSKYGETRSPTYAVWASMIARCTNPNNPRYGRYGGRGITVCEQWRNFETFLADMGERPGSDLSIDRINNDLGYAPENCRWATVHEQMSNTSRTRMITYNGKTQHLAGWALELGLNYKALGKRMKKMSFEEAIRRARGFR